MQLLGGQLWVVDGQLAVLSGLPEQSGQLGHQARRPAPPPGFPELWEPAGLPGDQPTEGQEFRLHDQQCVCR